MVNAKINHFWEVPNFYQKNIDRLRSYPDKMEVGLFVLSRKSIHYELVTNWNIGDIDPLR